MARINVNALSQFFLRLVRSLRNRKTGILIGIEFLLLTVLYAKFMFSDQVPLAGFVVLGMLWMARWWMTGRLTIATPMDMPVFGILVMLLVSLYASADWSLSLPKVYGVILGIAIFYAVVNAFDTIGKLEIAIGGLIILSLAVSGLGLVGADWLSNKLFSLEKVYQLLPRLIQELPRSIAGGIHPNIVGGALAFFMPLLVSLLWDGWEIKKLQFVTNTKLAEVLRATSKLCLIFSLAITSFTLLLTQSRGSIIGVAIGLFALMLWHNRRFLWAVPLTMLAILVLSQVWGVANLEEFISNIDIHGGSTLPGRVEIWQRAIYMIQSFPFTGIGIGTFDPVAHALYPFISFGDAYIPHAHNMLLEVAVDLGIPGLVLYIALLSGFVISAWRAYQAAVRPLRALIVGLVCGMLAHQIFGIMDAFMLGTKLGAAMWIYIGLVAALYVHRDQLADQSLGIVAGTGGHGESGEYERKAGTGLSLGSFLISFAYWMFFSMLAIAFIGDQPYLGLAIALVGGGILGFICMTPLESKKSNAPINSGHG